MRLRPLSFATLLALLCFAALGYGHQNQLLKKAVRPTINDVAKVLEATSPAKKYPFPKPPKYFSLYPKYLPWYRPLRIPYEKSNGRKREFRNEIKKWGPRAVVDLEAFYPGATFVTLGRDADTIGDVLEAFYRSIGDPHRVVRLGMSGETFDKSKTRQIGSYLRNHGLVRNVKALAEMNPIVILDRTSFDHGEPSQSVQLMKILYKMYLDQGADPEQLLRKVAMVSTDFGHTKLRRADFDSYIAREAKNLREKGVPKKILTLDSPLTDGATWNESFGRLISSSGTTSSNPGKRESRHVRKWVLWEMVQSIRIASSGNFLRAAEEYSLRAYQKPFVATKAPKRCQNYFW